MARKLIIAAAAAALAAAAVMVIPSHPAAAARPRHLVVIVEENNGLWSVQHKDGFQYLASLYGTGYGFHHYAALAHPSAPNYRAMISGQTGPLTDTSARFGAYTNATVFDQLTAHGISWAWYAEGMPSACYHGTSYMDAASQGEYVLRHVAALEYSQITGSAKCQDVLPLTSMDPASLPAVTFITPNLCHDYHGIPPGSYDPFPNCVKKTTALWHNSDSWTQSLVGKLTAAGATVWITFDECCGTTAPYQPEYMAEAGAGVTPGANWATGLNHYSILRAIEAWHGLPYLGGAKNVKPLPLG